MRIFQPGHLYQTGVMPFLGTLYPSLSLDLTREPTVYNDYHQLVARVCFLHSQQKGKAQVAAVDANQNSKGKQKQEQQKSDRFDKLEAQIAILT
uniref:Uncharacterized protein n=1 Tax=Chromera velia CCMP2878 TaxID=1169474 RepID=A0A0G4EY55_9ALVE|eukprot:Cvel_14240.t1-p1 / transcript=Cvel_14240.t1 / gene=Cvel_14240 / organism=Chromera_velia_CCMP2878 / gene_product=hypothetical protein / transcript_product=hypothetical protein / location=Cvel_scaffold1005:16430-16708(-) / protein_length=93 / sequence_SO=supercontig / SO=protein_coding / is_pseudo=false